MAYFEEARLTFDSARSIFDAASAGRGDLWAAFAKNTYDAIEQSVSAAIAAGGGSIPRNHPAQGTEFLERYEPGEDLRDVLLYWPRRRSDSQYVDVRGDTINVPHEQFGRADAERIPADAERVLEYVGEIVDS